MCGRQLDSSTPFCPHCGAALARPAAAQPQGSTRPPKPGDIVKGVFALVIIAGIFGCCTWLVWPTSEADKSQSSPPTAAQLTDAKYLSDRYGLPADDACADGADDYLRSVANYDYAWDHVGALETKFDDFLLLVKRPGVLTVVTNKAKLQNGFGAFQHVELYCDFDTQAYDHDPLHPERAVLGYSIELHDN